MPIPSFNSDRNSDGDQNLPAGIHLATWQEALNRFGSSTLKRRQLFIGIESVARELKKAGCKTLYLAGSVVTDKPEPNDFDCYYSLDGVDPSTLKQNAPVLCEFRDTKDREAQKAKYGGETFPGVKAFMKFFQTDREGNPKGIVAIDLDSLPP